MITGLPAQPSGVKEMNIRDAVCRRFNCRAEAYTDTALWRCLYPHARLAAKWLDRWDPNLFKSDRNLIQMVGNLDSLRDVRKEIESHRHVYRATGLWRGFLRIRLSGRRLIDLTQDVLQTANARSNVQNNASLALLTVPLTPHGTKSS